MVKSRPAKAGAKGHVSWEDPLEEEMATHSKILAWEIPWTEESGGLPSLGLQRVEHKRVQHKRVQLTVIHYNERISCTFK